MTGNELKQDFDISEMISQNRHIHFMQEALKEAQKAYAAEEIPIGAVIVLKDRIIARAHNQVEKLSDATAHAEMIAITAASGYLGSKFLDECEMYVTVEPCLMCAGALYWSRIGKVYYGASDNRFGYTRTDKNIFGKNINVQRGILADECSKLILEFFRKKRDADGLFK
ncbi:MAG TPA: nucleoside deaminase [Chitinophagales bacterium]|nr:nucleoside deaminase [Chitinophagales bacterium]